MVRKDHRQEVVAGLFDTRFAPGGGHARGRRRAMVAVGDVERRHGVEGGGDVANQRLVADDPDRMADAVVGGDFGRRGAGASLGEQTVGRWRVRVGQQDRAGLGIERLDLPYPVVFLVRAGELVLLDAPGVVGRHRGGGDETESAGGGPSAARSRSSRVSRRGAGCRRPASVAGSRSPWHRPPASRDRCRPAGRSPASRCAGSSRACRRRGLGLPRWTARRRAGGDGAGVVGGRTQAAQGLDERHGNPIDGARRSGPPAVP